MEADLRLWAAAKAAANDLLLLLDQEETRAWLIAARAFTALSAFSSAGRFTATERSTRIGINLSIHSRRAAELANFVSSAASIARCALHQRLGLAFEELFGQLGELSFGARGIPFGFPDWPFANRPPACLFRLFAGAAGAAADVELLDLAIASPLRENNRQVSVVTYGCGIEKGRAPKDAALVPAGVLEPGCAAPRRPIRVPN